MKTVFSFILTNGRERDKIENDFQIKDGEVHMRGTYNTRQRDEILSYLKSIRGSHVTVNEICAHFKEQGVRVGTTTVYRYLERLEQEGLVTKYHIDAGSAACFEYIERETECHHPVCYHLKCESCGRLIHLKCHEMSSVEEHILQKHGFLLNARKTVLYGLCEDCRE